MTSRDGEHGQTERSRWLHYLQQQLVVALVLHWGYEEVSEVTALHHAVAAACLQWQWDVGALQSAHPALLHTALAPADRASAGSCY